MQTSTIIAVTLAVGLLTASGSPFIAPVHAEGTAAEGKASASSATKSLTESVGNLSTDTSQTTKDAQALEVQKTIQGAGQVKQDAKDVKESATETLKNPLGTMGK